MGNLEQAPITGRFIAIQAPVALPGACTTCRGHKGPFIDTALSITGHGAVIICFQCLSAMADVAQLSESYATLRERRKHYARGYKDAILKTAAQIENTVNSLVQSQLDLSTALESMDDNEFNGDDSTSEPSGDDSGSSDSSNASAEVLLEKSGDDEGNLPEPESITVETDGSSSVEGRDDVPSNSDDGRLPSLII